MYIDHFLKKEVFFLISTVDYFIFNQIKCRFTNYVIFRKKGIQCLLNSYLGKNYLKKVE